MRRHPRTSALCPFFFNDTATTEIYTLSLHDALPIWPRQNHDVDHPALLVVHGAERIVHRLLGFCCLPVPDRTRRRSEEHTSELQSRQSLVCRLPLEKKSIITTHALTTSPLPSTSIRR